MALPPGWTVTKTLEEVPNPNFGTPAAGYFARWTYIATNASGQFVAASGSEEDCNNQAQAMAEARTQQRPYNEAS